jgi:cytoskeletal protein CcmA (bactofilin family)
MCKRCSAHLDLRDYRINSAVSRNFRTKGRFVIDEGGYLFNTDSIAGDVTIKGRLLGKLKAEGALELYSSAQIKGSFFAGNLIIPAGERFHWSEVISATAADISGELVGTLQATATVTLRKTARLFGDVQSGGLVIEPGAVFVGRAKINEPKQTRVEG